MARNLIKNPCGEEEFEFWEISENGGDGWKAEDVPGDCGGSFPDDGVTKYFASSFERCTKSQLIDLVAEGYSEDVLDNNQPNIVIRDWYSCRTDVSCLYDLCVQLLSETREVISEYNSDTIAIPQPSESIWSEISHTFSGYGPGVRFVQFTHGGQDSVFWKGWFGVRVTNSSVTVEE